MKRIVKLSVVTALVALPGVVTVSPAYASCSGVAGPAPIYSFTTIASSSRPTNLMSSYLKGPGTITYSKTTTATVSATISASATAEAGVIFAKASATMGVAVTGAKSWASGFTSSMAVPRGQTRRMRLFQESRSFVVTKKVFNYGTCSYKVAYSANANAPRSTRKDVWKLQS